MRFLGGWALLLVASSVFTVSRANWDWTELRNRDRNGAPIPGTRRGSVLDGRGGEDRVRDTFSHLSDWFDGVFQSMKPIKHIPDMSIDLPRPEPALSIEPQRDPSGWLQDWFGTSSARPSRGNHPVGTSFERSEYTGFHGRVQGDRYRNTWHRPSRPSKEMMMGDVFGPGRGMAGRPVSNGDGRGYTWTYSTGGNVYPNGGARGRTDGVRVGGRGGGGDGGGIGGGATDGRGGLGTNTWSWSQMRPNPYPIHPRFDMPDTDSFRNLFFRPRYHHQRPGRPGPGRDRSVPGPAYDTVCRGDHYSARRYNTSVWVSAAVINGSSMDALRRIKAYFRGENDQGVNLEMSRPLRMTVVSLNGTISNTETTLEDFVLSAMIPFDFQTNPPTPLDNMLNITEELSYVAYVTSIRRERRPGTPAIYDEFFDLQSTLESANEIFDLTFFHTAFYETWSDILSGFFGNTPRPGEILIPRGSAEKGIMCMANAPIHRGPQNGIKQCGKSKCPQYERLQRLRHDVEVRRIKSATYVTRTSPACLLSIPTIMSHFALQRYLSGANSESRTYPSPAPFFHYVYPSRLAACFCKQSMTSAYMLPANQTHAHPSERGVKLHTQPDREVYVMKFSGRPTARRVEAKVDTLRKYLRRAGLCFVRDRYAFAVYDHPFNRPPHLNEVMVFRKTGGCRWSDHGLEPVEDSWSEDVPVNDTTSSTPSPANPTVNPGITTNNGLMERTTLTDRAPPNGDGATTLRPLIELPLALETNSIESWNTDLIPYRFSGNVTDFPEDFPTDIFVY